MAEKGKEARRRKHDNEKTMGEGNQEAMKTQPEFVPYTDKALKRTGDDGPVLREVDRI